MRNNELRPPGSTPLPEANMAAEDKKESKESNHVHYDHTAVAVVDREDVAVANTVHMAARIAMAEAVGINLIQAMVDSEAVVLLNHNTRPNQCAIGVE